MVTNGDAHQYIAANYCAAFIDILGQRDALGGQGWLPAMKSSADQATFDEILKTNIGPILKLQRDAENLVGAMLTKPDSPFRMALAEELRDIWDQVFRKQVKTQYWSDGLVRFACLGGDNAKSAVNSILEIINFSGLLCFLGLAQHRPVRGAIEGAWGTEIRDGQLYGPVVSNAYELESEVAQYPRIIVGHRVVGFLEEVLSVQSDDPLSQLNRNLAKRCLELLLLMSMAIGLSII
jgi:hypothetical protein